MLPLALEQILDPFFMHLFFDTNFLQATLSIRPSSIITRSSPCSTCSPFYFPVPESLFCFGSKSVSIAKLGTFSTPTSLSTLT